MASWGAAEATFLLLTATFEVRPCLPHIECIETRACVCGSTFRPRSAAIFLSFFLLFSVLCLGVFQLPSLFSYYLGKSHLCRPHGECIRRGTIFHFLTFDFH